MIFDFYSGAASGSVSIFGNSYLIHISRTAYCYCSTGEIGRVGGTGIGSVAVLLAEVNMVN
jgi:hypothetical protein